MFSDLNNFLDIDIGHLPNGQCILVVEISGSNGSFILHHLLSLALRDDTPVCFVGLAQTFHHYACVGNKLTLNLSRLRDSGKLTFVDGLNSIGSNIVQSSLPHQTASASEVDSGNEFLKQLFSIVKEAIEKLPGWPDVSPLLIVDDLSILTSLGCKAYDVSLFFQDFRTMLCPHGGSTVSLIHTDLIDESRPNSLYCLSADHSDVMITVQPLKTGYCRDLSGEVSVEWKKRSGHVEVRQPRTMHFKISDKNVTLFPPGMSPAVL